MSSIPRVMMRAARALYTIVFLLTLSVAMTAALSAAAQQPQPLWEQVGCPCRTEVWRSTVAFSPQGDLVTVYSGYAQPEGEPDSPYRVPSQIVQRRRASGYVRWTRAFTPIDSTHAWITVDAVVFDAQENIYTAGTIYSPAQSGGPDEDFVIQKLDAAGNRLWWARYGTEQSLDVLAGIALDESGGLYVAGTSHVMTASGVRRGLTLVHYDAQGNQLLATTHSNPLSDEEAVSVASDHAGGVYVVATQRQLGASQPLAVRFAADGSVVWENRPVTELAGGAPTRSVSVSAVVDRTGALTYCVNGLDHADSVTCLKVSPEGRVVWRLEESRTGNLLMAIGLKIDSRGDTVLGTTAYNGPSAYGVTVIGPDGTRRWSSYWPARHAEMLAGSDLAVDPAGNVYVTGVSILDSGWWRWQSTVKFSAAGEPVWRFDYGGGKKSMFDLPAISVGPGRRVAVTGMTWWMSGADQVKLPAVYVVR